MQLQDWLAREGRGARARLARKMKTRYATVHAIAEGHVPKAGIALKIERATDGEVTAAEVLGVETVIIQEPPRKRNPRAVARAR